jgi:hypothetical protein
VAHLQEQGKSAATIAKGKVEDAKEQLKEAA